MTAPIVLTLNPGSSSIKLGVYGTDHAVPQPLGKAVIDLRATPLCVDLTTAQGTHRETLHAHAEDIPALVAATLDALHGHFAIADLRAVGHRVVHGADRFTQPQAIDDAVLDGITSLIPLAPLHQPQSVRLIQALRRHDPDLLQVATFDTAFHATQPESVRRLALPRDLYDAGIKRYGFHGLSYEYIAMRLREREPALAAGRIVVAHLGSGASLCALDNGVSQDTTMGFSTLDGIPMATRSGTLDPGVLLHLQQRRGMTVAQVEDLLYHQSGLLGLSGISGDIRALADNRAPEAQLACEIFAWRIAREIAALATSLGGLDGLVFTAGIGEHQPQVRAAVCQHLAWLGVRLDAAANAAHAECVNDPASTVAVRIIATDEEATIARHTVRVAQARGVLR